jgi:NADH-quinone oxidoreductase subunit E
VKLEPVDSIIARHRDEDGALIGILEDVQATYGYLPEEALRLVSARTGQPLVDIYGVATFYEFFTLKPRGRHVCTVCAGTSCHVRGAAAVLARCEAELGVRPGETTADRAFTLEVAGCLGACALGPMVVVDGHPFANVTTGAVRRLLAAGRAGLDAADVTTDRRVFPVDLSCLRCNHSLMDPGYLIDGLPSIRLTIANGGKHGWIRLSCIYGSYSLESEHELPHDSVSHFFCHAELRGALQCPECDAAMVPLIIRQGGVLQICSRRGCRAHVLDVDGVNA